MKARRILEIGAAVVLLAVVVASVLGYVRYQEQRRKETAAFVQAVLNSDLPRVQLLLKRGISPDLTDGGVPMLWYAAMADNFEIVTALLDHGANVNALHKSGDPVLVDVVRGGLTKMALFLLAHGANPELCRPGGETALIAAARSGYPAIVKALLARGVQVNALDGDGNTALMWASHWGRERIVEMLLKAGADVNRKNNKQLTARMQARSKGHVRIARLLQKSGAEE